MLLPSLAIITGLILLLWSADRFVEGAASSARYFGMSPLLIGMIVVGFGTSAPEMIVSAIASFNGSPSIALGNAYGSNITNIALILGITSLIKPVMVHSSILKKELPLLLFISIIAFFQLPDGLISQLDGIVLLLIFSVFLLWMVKTGRIDKDPLGAEMEKELIEHSATLNISLFRTFYGLIFLIAASRILVWGAVEIAVKLGVSELIIGLTIVAVGTSLPELASSIAAARKGEDDIALGNILGSNIFNTLAVVGIAGVIHPVNVSAEILMRDYSVMVILTVSLFVMGYGFRGMGRINRFEGGVLLFSYIAYIAFLVISSRPGFALN